MNSWKKASKSGLSQAGSSRHGRSEGAGIDGVREAARGQRNREGAPVREI